MRVTTQVIKYQNIFNAKLYLFTDNYYNIHWMIRLAFEYPYSKG